MIKLESDVTGLDWGGDENVDWIGRVGVTVVRLDSGTSNVCIALVEYSRS